MRLRSLPYGSALALVMALAGAPSVRAADPIFSASVLHELRRGGDEAHVGRCAAGHARPGAPGFGTMC